MVNRRSVNVRKRPASRSFWRQTFIGLFLVLVVILIGSAVWFGSRLESLTIVNVVVEGGETVDRDHVKRLVEQELEGSYYRIVPRRFSWTYPEGLIKEAVAGIERVRAVAVDRPDGRTVLVRFSEHVPAALWCDSQDISDCVFLNLEGYAFTKAPALSGTALLRYQTNETPQVAISPFESGFMKDTALFAAVVQQEFGWSVSMVERIGSEEATFSLNGGGLIKITLRQTILQTLENLRLVMASEEFQHLRSGSFQYIDLRFGDKVFVNEEAERSDDEKEISATSSTEMAL